MPSPVLNTRFPKPMISQVFITRKAQPISELLTAMAKEPMRFSGKNPDDKTNTVEKFATPDPAQLQEALLRIPDVDVMAIFNDDIAARRKAELRQISERVLRDVTAASGNILDLLR